MIKYKVLLSYKTKTQINTIILSDSNSKYEAIRLFKQLYRLTNDKRQFWDYKII